jgi:hypothetical protein
VLAVRLYVLTQSDAPRRLAEDAEPGTLDIGSGMARHRVGRGDGSHFDAPAPAASTLSSTLSAVAPGI